MLIVGNWKMNGSQQLARELSRAIVQGVSATGKGLELVLCPPFPFIPIVHEALLASHVQLGAQNASEHNPGAFTGEVGAAMLAEMGCRWVIVGHSERRALFGESSEQVAAKAAAVLSAGLRPIVCVGETLGERDANRTESAVASQLAPVAALLRDHPGRVVLAYEPVWAIGTGRSASPTQAAAVHEFIRAELSRLGIPHPKRLPILYGGSVKPDNAGALFATAGIDGGLIGGASLDAGDFLAIVRAAADTRSTTGVL